MVLQPFGPDFSGGIRTAVGDISGDGVPDLIVGTGPGVPTQVKVFDGSTGAELYSIQPFEPSFMGGVYVAVGDVNGDGVGDVVITPDEGGGARARVFSGEGFVQLNDYFGIEDPNFRGGARSAFGDLNGDGIMDLIVVAGFGGGPRVAAFDGVSVASGVANPEKLFPDFYAFEPGLRNGIFVTSADFDADGYADIIAGGGPGGGPRVLGLSGAFLMANQGLLNDLVPPEAQLANFFAGNPDNRGGVHVAAKDLDEDPYADLITGDGSGGGSQLSLYLGKDISPNGEPPVAGAFDVYPGSDWGIFVG